MPTLAEVVFVLWVCTPGATPADKPTCRPEALTAAMPASPQQLPQVCAALNAEGVKRWGTDGSEKPDWGNPVACFAVDYSSQPTQ